MIVKRRSRPRPNQSSKSSRRRQSRRQSRKRQSRRKQSRKRQSRRKSRSIGKVKKSNFALVKTLLGTAGLIGTGLAVKNLKTDYTKKYVYEENSLVPKDLVGKPIKPIEFQDRVDFAVRSKNYLKKKTNTYNLYTTYKVEIVTGNKLVSNLTKTVAKFPVIENTTNLPNYFIINAQLVPVDKDYSFVIYYQIKPETVKVATAIKNNVEVDPNLEEIVPAVKLLTNFVTDYDKYKDRFKGISSIVDTTSLGIGHAGNMIISTFNKPEGRSTLLNKTVTHFKNPDFKVFELDININKFIIPIPMFDINSISDYYDKTGKLKIDIGFVIEGGPNKKGTRLTSVENDLPEILLGGTSLNGFEIPSIPDPETFIIGDKIDEMKNIIKSETINKEDYYANFIGIKMDKEDNVKESILNKLKTNVYKPEKEMNLPIIKSDNRTDNKQFFLYARYFYYKNQHNPECELKTDIVSYSAGNGKYIARGTCFGNDRVHNVYQCTNGPIKTYRFGFAIKNAFDEVDFTSIVVEKINEFKPFIEKHFSYFHKKLICISLLTPCNTSICKLIEKGSKILPKEAYINFMENTIINAENKAFHELGHIFINVPLSSSKAGILFKGGNKSIGTDSITQQFENLIVINGPKETFETIVNITSLYYNKFKHTHDLCYHCRSGKDRSGLCDSIVQATIYYLRTNSSKIDYEKIRVVSRYFLLFSYVITFYSTGIPGIKMNNIPVATYILGPKEGSLYKFFLGNSKLSSS
jgi:hypothetical protein